MTPEPKDPRLENKCECTCGKLGCYSRRQLPPLAHGVPGYEAGCKCDICRYAGTATTAVRKARIQSESLAGASKRGEPWTGPDLELATRTDLTAQEAAALLGRTYKAVKHVRWKCRHDPKFLEFLGAPSHD